LYEWEKAAMGYDAKFETAGESTEVIYYRILSRVGSSVAPEMWQMINFGGNFGGTEAEREILYPTPLGTVTNNEWTYLYTTYPEAIEGDYLYYDQAAYTGSYTGPQLVAKDVALIKSVTQIMAECLSFVWSSADGLTAYDTWIGELQTEMEYFQSKNIINYPSVDFDVVLEKYRAGANVVLASAGIVPGKSEGSAVSTGCWTSQDEDYWNIEGYAPAFTNTAYISTKFSSDGAPYSTKEFGFFIACKCPNNLKYGDSIAINISGGATSSKTYQLGDTFEIPVISASPTFLSGGVDGNDTVTWNVAGMTDGALTPHQVVNDTSPHYIDATTGLEFDMTLGGIPFALGDQFRFSIESNRFRWRKNNGDWSETMALDSAEMSDGLTAIFTPGVSPSYSAGDIFSFAAKQPASPANVTTPRYDKAWIFSAGAVLSITPENHIDITAISIVHSLPSGTIITFSSPLFDMAHIHTGSTGIEYLEGNIQHIESLTLTVSAAGSIAYVYLGTPLTTAYAPDSIELRRQWDMIRGQKSNFGAMYLAQGYAGKITWQNFISTTEFNSHIDMIDYVKRNGDEPIIFIPHYLHSEEAFLCRIESDQVDMLDLLQYHPDTETSRLMNLTIPFVPVTK
jgi:hypothetical protein